MTKQHKYSLRKHCFLNCPEQYTESCLCILKPHSSLDWVVLRQCLSGRHSGTPGASELLRKFSLLNERGKVTGEDGIDTSGVVLFKNLWEESRQKVEVLATQSCSTLCDSVDCVAHQTPLSMGILQARKLEWVAIAFFRGSSWLRDWTRVSCIAGRFFTAWVTRKPLKQAESSSKNKSQITSVLCSNPYLGQKGKPGFSKASDSHLTPNSAPFQPPWSVVFPFMCFALTVLLTEGTSPQDTHLPCPIPSPPLGLWSGILFSETSSLTILFKIIVSPHPGTLGTWELLRKFNLSNERGKERGMGCVRELETHWGSGSLTVMLREFPSLQDS